jgi:hypothetical protein
MSPMVVVIIIQFYLLSIFKYDGDQSHYILMIDVNYPLLAVNAGVIASIFIFFALASQVPTSTIFALETKKCSFGFNLSAQHAQIAVAMVGGVLILPFSVSSVLALIRVERGAIIGTSIGFALMFVAAIAILSSLSCRIPFDFLIDMIVIPTVITGGVIAGLSVL